MTFTPDRLSRHSRGGVRCGLSRRIGDVRASGRPHDSPSVKRPRARPGNLRETDRPDHAQAGRIGSRLGTHCRLLNALDRRLRPRHGRRFGRRDNRGERRSGPGRGRCDLGRSADRRRCRRRRLGRGSGGRRNRYGSGSYQLGRGGRGLLRSARGGRRARRQQRQRIDVTLRIARDAHAEVDERLGEIDVAARPHSSDDGAFPDERAPGHTDRPQVDERGGVAERCLDRNCLSAARNRAGERDHSLRRSEDRMTAGRAEIDAAVLTGGVRMGAIERERSQHWPVDGPGPRARDGHG